MTRPAAWIAFPAGRNQGERAPDHCMENSGQPTLKIPIILLSLADLAMLSARLWPWQEAMNLPGNGTTALDPAISLVAYAGLGFWIGSARTASARRSLFSAAVVGIVAGMFLMGQVALAAQQKAEQAGNLDRVQIALLAGGALVIGIAGLRTARAGHTLAFCAVCSIWSAMVACLMAVTTILGEAYFAMGPAESNDPWKQYQGLAIGTPAMQTLVQSLDMIAGFLLIGPIVGCIAGSIFASFANPRKA